MVRGRVCATAGSLSALRLYNSGNINALLYINPGLTPHLKTYLSNTRELLCIDFIFYKGKTYLLFFFGYCMFEYTQEYLFERIDQISKCKALNDLFFFFFVVRTKGLPTIFNL